MPREYFGLKPWIENHLYQVPMTGFTSKAVVSILPAEFRIDPPKDKMAVQRNLAKLCKEGKISRVSLGYYKHGFTQPPAEQKQSDFAPVMPNGSTFEVKGQLMEIDAENQIVSFKFTSLNRVVKR